MLVLFTDTDTDITPQVAKEYGYRLISMPYTVGDTDVHPYADSDTFDFKPFYDMLRGGTIPKTSAIGSEAYVSYFEPVFAAGDDILYVHFSRAMTATFDVMDKTVAELLKKYPERRFYAIDTMSITIGCYYLVREIGDLYLQGKTAEELVAYAEREIQHTALYFFADDLKFFRASGRVSGIAGAMGTLLGIRPIIYVDKTGRMVSIGKEKGRRNAVEHLLRTVDELGDSIKEHRVIIGHTDAPEIADEVEARLIERFGSDLRTEKVIVNPTIGSHCGPNGVGICFHAIHR